MNQPPDLKAPLFRIRNLTRTYDLGHVKIHALQGIDLDLYARELVVLLGASGSGKSTLMNIIGGLDLPDQGEILYMGRPLPRLSHKELTRYRKEHVGFVFQSFNLIPSLTARENVAIVTEISSSSMRPEQALELVGLQDRMDHFPAMLSGGEQQRVAIARAVAKRPAVLLCDEPTGALDSRTGVKVLKAIEHINRTMSATTMIITHNRVISKMADRIIRVSDGLIAGIEKNQDKADPMEMSW